MGDTYTPARLLDGKSVHLGGTSIPKKKKKEGGVVPGFRRSPTVNQAETG